MTDHTSQDLDPIETQEWLSALRSVIKYEGVDRARFLVNQLITKMGAAGSKFSPGLTTPYINTITHDQEEALPDDGVLAENISRLIRWNAMSMVIRAGKKGLDVGGHIATYASAATLYETGFNYFFHAPTAEHGGDLILYQGHSSPGMYARAFLEGRLTEKQLDNFRQEINGNGLPSYPHPWLMPDFWQFATVSMGIGPYQAVYQAHFLKYLENRGLAKTMNRKIWAFCGDGEMDEPESVGALALAGREKLDNLIFVINCNLQRLDGPVRGNQKVVQELESIFRGAGWNVIKVLTGSNWDPLFAKDKNGLLQKRFDECLDGEYQNYVVKGGAFFREHFFGASPELAALVADMTDEQLAKLTDGGHDPRKVYAAYASATKHKGQPTVILVKTVKGYGMGTAGEGLNIAHQQKKLEVDNIKAFRDRFNIPVADTELEKMPYISLAKDSAEYNYLHERRKTLGGYLPQRNSKSPKLAVPNLDAFSSLLEDSGEREFSTTMAYGRILAALVKDKNIGKNIVPIVADESRTFGLEGMFRQIGIYNTEGQKYEPVDRAQLMYYHEATNGQILQEGINEAGAFSAWLAAGLSYSTNNLPMIPFYIYYSMFGYQRIGDFAWAAGDMQARGFLIGATAGRTTLAGEGLQHQDGHNIIGFDFIPNVICYDPCFAYELAVIIHDGLKRMYVEQQNIFYYITAMNENYQHPAMPKDAEQGIIKGMYLFRAADKKAKLKVQLLGSGTILREVIKAADLLAKEYNISADIWSITSFTELRREALAITRHNHLHPKDKAKVPYVTECLQNRGGPVISATDYIKLYSDMIRAFVPYNYYVLGTDGYGRSDGRNALRHFFEVDANMIAYTALKALHDEGKFKADELIKAMKQLNIDANKLNPMAV